jgi:hypothetical protein
MRRFLWIAAISTTLLTSCNYDDGACWSRTEDDGHTGAGGGPIVPGGGGYGDAPEPKPQDTTDPATMGGCDDTEWSDNPVCSRQYASDREKCRKAKTERCWFSAMQRLAYCNKTKGQTGFPELDN